MAHEAYEPHSTPPEPPSNRAFGLTVGGIGMVLALLPWIRTWGVAAPRLWLLVPALLLMLLGAVWPASLRWPNIWWMRLALILSKVTNPIVTGMLFFLFVTPMGWILRACGKDPLRRHFDSGAETYWIDRKEGQSQTGGMGNQF